MSDTVTFSTKQVNELFDSVKGFKTKFDDKFAAMQSQVDAIDLRGQDRLHAAHSSKAFVDLLKENDSVAQLMRDRKGAAIITLKGQDAAAFLERKTTVTSAAVGASTSGVLGIERIPGIVPEARQVLRVRDVLYARPTEMQLIDFVRVLSPMAIASPQVEASAKAENALTFTTESERVRTIATWIPGSKQLLDDMNELSGFLQTSLAYYVDLEEERQLLSGSGTGEDLNGLITQGTAFSSSLLSATQGWNKIDIIARAIQQITASKELDPTFVILHPNDWWGIRTIKDGFGRYILGDPQLPSMGGTQNVAVIPNIFGLNVVHTTSIADGTFLIGSGSSTASEIRDRMEMQIEISTSHSDFFTRNLLAIRAEKRLALVVKRPGSYVVGSFSTSPQ